MLEKTFSFSEKLPERTFLILEKLPQKTFFFSLEK